MASPKQSAQEGGSTHNNQAINSDFCSEEKERIKARKGYRNERNTRYVLHYTNFRLDKSNRKRC